MDLFITELCAKSKNFTGPAIPLSRILLYKMLCLFSTVKPVMLESPEKKIIKFHFKQVLVLSAIAVC